VIAAVIALGVGASAPQVAARQAKAVAMAGE
jgi:hypothetical protein